MQQQANSDNSNTEQNTANKCSDTVYSTNVNSTESLRTDSPETPSFPKQRTERYDCVLSSHEEARKTHSQLNMRSSQKDTHAPSQQTVDTSEQTHNKLGEHTSNRNIESHYVAGQPIFYHAQTHSSQHHFIYVGTASEHEKGRTINMLKYSCNTK